MTDLLTRAEAATEPRTEPTPTLPLAELMADMEVESWNLPLPAPPQDGA